MSTRVLPAQTEWLRADARAEVIGVDREKRVLRGYVVAQRGAFKTEGRGQFDDESLAQIVRLMKSNPKGTKSRFAHPTLSDDGLGKFLGRSWDPRIDGDRVRADLHLSASSFESPAGNLGGYILDLAESDPDALSSSLVIQTDKLPVLDEHGRPELDEAGKEIPPIWRPTKIHASDIVDEGDAVDGLLSAQIDVDELSDAVVRRSCELLDKMFPGQPRESVEARCLVWLGRYLDTRYGPATSAQRGGHAARLRRALRLKELGFRPSA